MNTNNSDEVKQRVQQVGFKVDLVNDRLDDFESDLKFEFDDIKSKFSKVFHTPVLHICYIF